MKKFMFLFLTCFMIVGIGCGWKDCPDYPEYIKKYMPYRIGSVLSFSNERLDTLTFRVVEYDVPNYKDMVPCVTGCAGGILSAKLISDSIKIDYELLDGGGSLELSCHFYYSKEEYFLWWYKAATDGSGPDIETIIDDTMELNNNTDSRITDMKIERNVGLIEFRDALNNCTWKLVR